MSATTSLTYLSLHGQCLHRRRTSKLDDTGDQINDRSFLLPAWIACLLKQDRLHFKMPTFSLFSLLTITLQSASRSFASPRC